MALAFCDNWWLVDEWLFVASSELLDKLKLLMRADVLWTLMMVVQ